MDPGENPNRTFKLHTQTMRYRQGLELVWVGDPVRRNPTVGGCWTSFSSRRTTHSAKWPTAVKSLHHMINTHTCWSSHSSRQRARINIPPCRLQVEWQDWWVSYITVFPIRGLTEYKYLLTVLNLQFYLMLNVNSDCFQSTKKIMRITMYFLDIRYQHPVLTHWSYFFYLITVWF